MVDFFLQLVKQRREKKELEKVNQPSKAMQNREVSLSPPSFLSFDDFWNWSASEEGVSFTDHKQEMK